MAFVNATLDFVKLATNALTALMGFTFLGQPVYLVFTLVTLAHHQLFALVVLMITSLLITVVSVQLPVLFLIPKATA
jgi:hypothetical protein